MGGDSRRVDQVVPDDLGSHLLPGLLLLHAQEDIDLY